MRKRSLRIAIACYPTIGGSGILATELGVALAEQGHEVHFVAYADPPRLGPTARVRVHKVAVSAYPLFKYPPYDLALASKLRELLVSEKLDIVHVHYAIPHAICAYLALQMASESSAKIITTLHGTDITVVGCDKAYQEVTRFGIEKSDRVIAVSAFLAAETRRLFHVDKEILVVPNFVDTRRFCPPHKPRSGPFRVGHVSNFRAVKRPLDVIRAFALIHQQIPVRLLLLGDGPQLSACLELATNLGLRDQIHALGPVQDVERVLPSTDILLQPSGSEAFGLAALEASACGIPVVGYRIGGLPEVLVDGETGFLVPFRDVNALAARAIEILNNAPLRTRLASNGRKRAVELFDVPRSVQRHEEIYYEVLGSPPDSVPE